MSCNLSICIPTYNRITQLSSLLDYLENEKCFNNPKMEVVISNNNSTDGTFEFLNSKKNYENIKIVHQSQNLGLVGNLLALQEYCTGKYIWYIGDDDKLISGTIQDVLKCIETNLDVHHLFINFSEVEGKKVLTEKMYLGNKTYFKNGFELFESITNDSELGALMFLTANVFLREDVIKVNKILEKNDELCNLALPLGYSLYCSQYPSYAICETKILDEVKNVSWKDKMILVWCRDMIAICDVIGNNINKGNYVRKMLLDHLPKKYPEIFYFLYGKKFKRSNYAMKMYFIHFKLKLFFDFICFPFYIIKKIITRFLK